MDLNNALEEKQTRQMDEAAESTTRIPKKGTGRRRTTGEAERWVVRHKCKLCGAVPIRQPKNQKVLTKALGVMSNTKAVSGTLTVTHNGLKFQDEKGVKKPYVIGMHRIVFSMVHKDTPFVSIVVSTNNSLFQSIAFQCFTEVASSKLINDLGTAFQTGFRNKQLHIQSGGKLEESGSYLFDKKKPSSAPFNTPTPQQGFTNPEDAMRMVEEGFRSNGWISPRNTSSSSTPAMKSSSPEHTPTSPLSQALTTRLEIERQRQQQVEKRRNHNQRNPKSHNNGHQQHGTDPNAPTPPQRHSNYSSTRSSPMQSTASARSSRSSSSRGHTNDRPPQPPQRSHRPHRIPTSSTDSLSSTSAHNVSTPNEKRPHAYTSPLVSPASSLSLATMRKKTPDVSVKQASVNRDRSLSCNSIINTSAVPRRLGRKECEQKEMLLVNDEIQEELEVELEENKGDIKMKGEADDEEDTNDKEYERNDDLQDNDGDAVVEHGIVNVKHSEANAQMLQMDSFLDSIMNPSKTGLKTIDADASTTTRTPTTQTSAMPPESLVLDASSEPVDERENKSMAATHTGADENGTMSSIENVADAVDTPNTNSSITINNSTLNATDRQPPKNGVSADGEVDRSSSPLLLSSLISETSTALSAQRVRSYSHRKRSFYERAAVTATSAASTKLNVFRALSRGKTILFKALYCLCELKSGGGVLSEWMICDTAAAAVLTIVGGTLKRGRVYTARECRGRVVCGQFRIHTHMNNISRNMEAEADTTLSRENDDEKINITQELSTHTLTLTQSLTRNR
eukprot:m.124934 g.124934  ORF g.124934 m.124934 type:complete len:793 (+) comp12968_c0_seq2:60-2438(+)